MCDNYVDRVELDSSDDSLRVAQYVTSLCHLFGEAQLVEQITGFHLFTFYRKKEKEKCI